MQHTFTGNTVTFAAESMVSALLLEQSARSVEYGYVGLDAWETREFSAYCIMSRYLEGQQDVDTAIIDELRRLYPKESDEAELAAYERKYDI